MFIEQIIEFELRGCGPLGHTCNLKNGYFYDKTKIFKASSELLLTAKNIAEGNVPWFLSPGPSQLQNLFKKC